MVTVTGYLYAAAGVAASVFGLRDKAVIRRFGLAVSAGYPLGVALLLGIICLSGPPSDVGGGARL